MPIVPIRDFASRGAPNPSWEQIYSNALSTYLIRYGRPMIKGCNGIAITLAVAGRVDGGVVTPEQLHRVLATGCCRVLADLVDVPLDYALYGLVASAATLRSQPGMIRRFLEGLIEGIAVFRTRPDVVWRFSERKE